MLVVIVIVHYSSTQLRSSSIDHQHDLTLHFTFAYHQLSNVVNIRKNFKTYISFIIH